MMRYFAIPVENGRERMGTLGVLAGTYKSRETFTRYRLRRYAEPGRSYNLYTVDDVSRWNPIGTYRQAKGRA